MSKDITWDIEAEVPLSSYMVETSLISDIVQNFDNILNVQIPRMDVPRPEFAYSDNETDETSNFEILDKISQSTITDNRFHFLFSQAVSKSFTNTDRLSDLIFDTITSTSDLNSTLHILIIFFLLPSFLSYISASNSLSKLLLL
ncbi:hypothetical protein GEMRC1_002870 [Eukaryota sp. GEM-RC1]